MKYKLLVLLTSLTLFGCGYVFDKKVVGHYRIIGVDTFNELSLSYTLRDGNSVGRVSGNIISVGFDKKHIVVELESESRLQYYYLIRELDHEYAEPKESVRGPFNQLTYLELSKELNLPDCTIKIKPRENQVAL